MTIDDLVRTFSGGFCHGEKRAECATCQNRERAIEHVRRMAAVVEAARRWTACVYEGSRIVQVPCGVCPACRLRETIDALDGGGR